jgi:pilus assembly protein CpaB
MKRRVIGIAIAVVMALAGTALVASFVKSAEARALAGEELVTVMVVDQPIAAGASPEEMEGRTRLEQVPTKVRATGALENLDLVAGLVTEIALQPGEQVTASRFVAPDVLTRARVPVPDGLLEVTLALEPERAVGGALLPGDTVAVVVSFEPFDIGAPPSVDPNVPETVIVDGIRLAGDAKTPNSTRMILESVLVTNVQLEELPPEPDEQATSGRSRTPAPTGNLLITVALDPASIERVLFGAEHGTVWLAAQHTEIDLRDTRVVTRGRIYGLDGTATSEP